MSNEKVLIVEDDINISNMLKELLCNNDYSPIAAYSGTEATLQLSLDEFSLVLLDLMLPGKTGEEVLEEIRKSSNIPVIVLTARTDKDTTVKLLKMGADDFISKPFDNNELLARIDVALRHAIPQKSKSSQLKFKDITLDLDGFIALIGNKNVDLSKREFEILRMMMDNPNKVFTKNNLYESVWGGEFFGDDNTVNVHISKLRAKLNAISPDTEYIRTVWGIGFKMNE